VLYSFIALTSAASGRTAARPGFAAVTPATCRDGSRSRGEHAYTARPSPGGHSNAALPHTDRGGLGRLDQAVDPVSCQAPSSGTGRGRAQTVSLGVRGARAGEGLDAASGALCVGLSVPPRPRPAFRLVGGCGPRQAAALAPNRVDQTRGQSSARCARGRALDHGEPFIWCWPAPAGVPPTPRQGHGRRQPLDVAPGR
jgi:hypothetical protein